MSKLITVCIPAYEMRGLGHIFIKESLDILRNQIFKDFDVVVCDNSKDDKIKELCANYPKDLEINYFANPKGTSLASNLNFVINNNCATGKFIRILAQDDYLYNEKVLEVLANNIDEEKDFWILNAGIHTRDGKNFFAPFYPRYNNAIHLGKNTIGGLSILTIKNENKLLFDETLLWLIDCEYYKRCYDKYGLPKIINEIGTVVRLGDYSITNTEATLKIRRSDVDRMLEKYESGFKYWYYKISINFIKYPLQRVKGYMQNLKK